jgi:hypothetical protein
VKKGDRVRVRRDPGDEWCDAYVVLVSENGKSVGLLLSGLVRAGDGFIGGALPLMVDPKTQTVEGLTGDAYEIEAVQ